MNKFVPSTFHVKTSEEITISLIEIYLHKRYSNKVKYNKLAIWQKLKITHFKSYAWVIKPKVKSNTKSKECLVLNVHCYSVSI